MDVRAPRAPRRPLTTRTALAVRSVLTSSSRRASGARVGRLATAYALCACLGLALLVVVGDRTAVTYTLGLVAFWWLVPSLPLLALAVLARRWVAVAALLVPAVVAGTQVVPTTWAPDAAGTRALSVLSWNITGGAPTDDVVALVRARRPDVVVLQEVQPAARSALQVLRPRYRYQSASPLDGPAEPNWAGVGDGTLVLSRYPITRVRHVSGLPAAARPMDAVTLSVRGRPLLLVPVHLASPCVGCPPRQVTGLPQRAGSTGQAARVRSAEVRRVAALVRAARAAGTGVVVAGDVNSSPLNAPLRVLRAAGLVDAHRAVGWGPGLTRGAWPGIARVDVVLSAGLRPLAVSVPGRGASTHAPVVTELAWS